MIKTTLIIIVALFFGKNIALASTGSFTTYPSYTKDQNKWIIRDVNPGHIYKEYITLENLSEFPIVLKIKIIESNGDKENINLLENQPSKNLGKWIKPELENIQLGPKEKRRVKLEIKIPETAKTSEYQAVAMVSLKQEKNALFNIETRIGNRIYLNVTDNKNLQSNTLNPTLSTENIILIVISLAGILFGLSPQKLINQKSA